MDATIWAQELYMKSYLGSKYTCMYICLVCSIAWISEYEGTKNVIFSSYSYFKFIFLKTELSKKFNKFQAILGRKKSKVLEIHLWEGHNIYISQGEILVEFGYLYTEVLSVCGARKGHEDYASPCISSHKNVYLASETMD